MWNKIFKIAYEKVAGRERGDPTPELVDHVAARIMKEHPEYTREQAYAIAVKQLQRYGYLKPGTMELTEKGKKQSQKHYQHPRALEWRQRGY
jgi:hypothetical protein